MRLPVEKHRLALHRTHTTQGDLSMNRINWTRALVAALAAFVVTNLTFIILFGNPIIQRVFYSNAAGQSEKFVNVWKVQQPTPALSPAWDSLAELSGRKLAVLALLYVWLVAVTISYAVVADSLPGTGWR